jgi:hypothetical protein
MKRFLAFGGQQYYPSGGWGDFAGSFDTADEAETAARHRSSAEVQKTYKGNSWWHVVDGDNGTVLRGAVLGWSWVEGDPEWDELLGEAE